MKNKSHSRVRRVRTRSIQWEGAQFPNRWFKRLLVIHRCPAILAKSRCRRVHPVEDVKVADVKYVGCRRTSAGEMFALYVLPADTKAFSAESARFSAMSIRKRALEKKTLENWPVLYSSSTGAPRRLIYFDRGYGNSKAKTI
jgi:hypothetical protein